MASIEDIVDIFFSDLTPEAQERVKKSFGLKSLPVDKPLTWIFRPDPADPVQSFSSDTFDIKEVQGG